MIPQCYPSVVNTVTGAREMQVFILSSVSGLVRWTDYIPIKFTDANPKKENTTDVGGYIPIKALSSTTGYTSWVDYVPVYVDSSATDAWQCSNVGFIPYSYGATLDLNFLTYTSLPSTVTFTRGSSGTFFGSDGLLKVQGYNYVTGSDLFTTGWATTNLQVTSGNAVPTATSGQHKTTVTFTYVGIGTMQFKAKPNGYSVVALSNTPNNFVYFNLSGAGSISTLGTGWSAATCTLQSDGYYLCTATSASVTWGTAIVYVCDAMQASGNTAPPSYSGNTTSGVLIKECQVEAGSTATQYSPTTTAANSAPRLDYDPATLLPRGLLVEEQRTNNETNGVAFSKGVAGDTVTQNAVGPDGLTSAYSIAGDGTSSGSHIVYQASVTPTSGNTYTISVFLKAGTQSLVQLFTASAHSGATVYCNYNLSSPAMTAGAGIVAGSNFQTYIGNGWYRCGFSYVASATAIGAAVVTAPISSISDSRSPVVAFSTTYYRFGGQYESTTGMGSAPFVTSYIPTTTASATRSADSALMNGTNFSSWYNQTQGTFVVESDQVNIGSQMVLHVDDGTVSNRIYLNTSSGTRAFNVEVATVTQVAFAVTGALTANTTSKTAVCYATNDFAGCTNGGTVGVDTSGTLPTVNAMLMGVSRSGSTASYLNGHIRRIQYYPTRLPNATLQTLTA